MKATFKQFLEAKYYLQGNAWISLYQQHAKEERKAGGSVEINYGIPYVAVNLSNGEEYFLQGEDAERLLDEVPDEISAEDWLLAKEW